MARLFYAVLVGLVGAGIVHVVVLMLLPAMSERDAWSRLARAGDLYTVTSLYGAGVDQRVLRSTDPLFRAVACRFDLADGVAHITASGSVPFWSISVYDRGGQNIYSFNDRTANGGVLDLVVLTPAQMIETRKAIPDELRGSVFIEADIEQGIVVIRSFVPDPSWTPAVDGFLASAACRSA